MKSELPLEGIRVIDFTAVYSGPFCTKILADLGAEVIKLESIQAPDRVRVSIIPEHLRGRPDSCNYGAFFHQFNRNKYDLTLNLARPKGKDVFRRLAEISDVFVTNYPRRVLENLGLNYSAVKAMKNDIIMVSVTGYGLEGPDRDLPALGPSVEAGSGIASLTGYGDGIPVPSMFPLSDGVVGLHAAFATMDALHYHRRTGRGQLVEVSMSETILCLMEEAIMEYTMNHREPAQPGVKCFAGLQAGAPDGFYQCRGEDKWIAVSVNTEKEWKSLCNVMENPEWARATRFSDAVGRSENRAELDKLFGEWTMRQEPYKLMHILQGAGIAAGMSFGPREILNGPHFKSRDFFWEVDAPGKGPCLFPGAIIRLMEAPGKLRMPPPTLGQHNGYILGEVLGMTDDEISALEQEKIIGTIPVTQPAI